MLAALLLAYEFVDVYGAIMQVGFGQIVHAVVHLRLQHIMRYHGVEQTTANLYAVVGQHVDVVLQVLPHFQRGLVLVNATETLYNGLSLGTLCRHGNIVAFVLAYGEA